MEDDKYSLLIKLTEVSIRVDILTSKIRNDTLEEIKRQASSLDELDDIQREILGKVFVLHG